MRQILIIFPVVLILCFLAAKTVYSSNASNAKNTENKNELIKLGKRLYYAKIMAGNTMSCATCHVQSVDTYTYCGRKGGLMLSLNNINKKLAERNKIKKTKTTLREITEKCFKIITGQHLSSKEIHAIDVYVRTLK